MIYDITLLLTAVIAGFMLSYSVTLGAYFNYLLRQELDQGFSHFYSQFRRNTAVASLYRIFVSLQFFLGLMSLLVSSPLVTVRVLGIIPLMVLLVCHHVTGFAKSEEAINSGKPISTDMRQNYLKWNLPLHYFYFVIYFVSALLQLYYR